MIGHASLIGPATALAVGLTLAASGYQLHRPRWLSQPPEPLPRKGDGTTTGTCVLEPVRGL